MIKRFLVLILSGIIIIGSFSLEVLAGESSAAVELLKDINGKVCEDQINFQVDMDNNTYLSKLNTTFDEFCNIGYEVYTVKLLSKNKLMIMASLKEGCDYDSKVEDLIRKVNLNYNTNTQRTIKIKIADKDEQHINNTVLEILRKKKAEGINTVKLHNGNSTVCRIRSAKGPLMGSMQLAVVSYPSGTYVVIGTPEITLAF